MRTALAIEPMAHARPHTALCEASKMTVRHGALARDGMKIATEFRLGGEPAPKIAAVCSLSQ
jgi:hypothetical protein